FVSTGGRAVNLYQTFTLLNRLQTGIAWQLLPPDVSLAIVPPGNETERFLLSQPVGAGMPGWRLALSLKDQRLFDTTAEQRIASYVWIGVLMFATVIVLVALALRLVRRQMALTQLRNDFVANVTPGVNTPL